MAEAVLTVRVQETAPGQIRVLMDRTQEGGPSEAALTVRNGLADMMDKMLGKIQENTQRKKGG